VMAKFCDFYLNIVFKARVRDI